MYRLLIIFSLFMVNLACTDSDDLPQYLIQLKTDQNIYSADSSTTIYLNVSNNGTSPVYFLCKGVILLEEYENENLNKSWTVHGFEYCGSSTPIDPNSEYTWDLTFLDWHGISDAKFDKSVIYKLYFDLYIDNNLKTPMINDDQTANSFKIIRE